MNSQEDLNTRYLSYMLRIWRKRDGGGKPVWCASLEEPGSRHTESFGDVSALFSYLQLQLGVADQGEHAHPELRTPQGLQAQQEQQP